MFQKMKFELSWHDIGKQGPCNYAKDN